MCLTLVMHMMLSNCMKIAERQYYCVITDFLCTSTGLLFSDLRLYPNAVTNSSCILIEQHIPYLSITISGMATMTDCVKRLPLGLFAVAVERFGAVVGLVTIHK